VLNLAMQTGNHLDPREGWGEVNEVAWARLQSLLDLVREEHRRTELSPERRERIHERVMERLERNEIRRRRRRAVVAVVGAAVLASVVVTLVVHAHAG
jgi:hypothetical protein